MSSGRRVAGREPGAWPRLRGGHRSLLANNIHILEEDEVLAPPPTTPTSEYPIEVPTGLSEVSQYSKKALKELNHPLLRY